MGEHLPCKQGVKSSNLSISTQIMRKTKFFERSGAGVNTCHYLKQIMYLENRIRKETIEISSKKTSEVVIIKVTPGE